MGSDDKLAKHDQVPGALARQREELDLDVRRKKVDAAVKVVDLLVRGGHVFLSVQEANAEMAKSRQATDAAINVLDAQTSAELQKLEQALRGERDKTERLRIIADLAARQEKVDPVLAEALAQALRATFPVP